MSIMKCEKRKEEQVGDVYYDGYLYYHIDSKERTAEVYRFNDNIIDVKIPSEIQIDNTIFTVNSIGYKAFINSHLVSLIIPDTVKIIKSHAFYNCKKLERVLLGEKVERIEDNAFWFCINLRFVNIYQCVRYIGDFAFYGCPIFEDINLCNIETIGKQAFSGIKVKKLVISGMVKVIGDFAFSDCENLKEVYIGPNVTHIGKGVFSESYNLESVIVDEANPHYDSRDNCNAIIETESNTIVVGIQTTICPDSLVAIGKWAFAACETMDEIKIGKNVEKIEDNAYIRINFTNPVLTFPEKVKTIGENTFEGCTGIKSVFIGSKIERIGEDAFPKDGLEEVVVDGGNKIYDSRNHCNAIIETSTNKVVFGCKNTIIPDGISIIGTSAFSSCEDLTIINIPCSVTKIEDNAFMDCPNLKTIIIPPNVVSIGNAAFAIDFAIFRWESGELSRGIRHFYSQIENPERCDVRDEVFYYYIYDCQSDDIRSEATLYVPKGSIEKYIKSAVWSQFKSIIEMDKNEM